MMHTAVGEHYGEDAFDLNRCKCVFELVEVQQKFTSKALYEKKFIWVTLSARSLHMSDHSTKERKHKEASLTDVTEVIMAAPKVGTSPNPALCLTVVFRRGGGIDLQFDSQNTRDIWAETLKKIIKQVKESN